VPDLIATGLDPAKSWRQPLPANQTVRVGRAPRSGWMVPWDPCISRDHADVQWDGKRLTVQCVETAVNPIYYKGEPTRKFSITIGEQFRIAGTTFHLTENSGIPTPASTPQSDESGIASSISPAMPTDAVPGILDEEIKIAIWTLQAQADLTELDGYSLLENALRDQFDSCRDQIFLLLSFFHADDVPSRARLQFSDVTREQQEAALMRIKRSIPDDIEEVTFPLLRADDPEDALENVPSNLVPESLSATERLIEIIGTNERIEIQSWPRAAAIFCVVDSHEGQYIDAVEKSLASDSPIVRETAVFALAKLAPDIFQKYKRSIRGDSDQRVVRASKRMQHAGDADVPDLLTVEKVQLLNRCATFAQTADHVLADVSTTLGTVELQAGETLFKKGDVGNCMYIILDGNVRIHDGNKTLNELGPNEIFGEMTALDPEPRSASVTATEDTRLFQLDQATLFDLMADRTEVVRGIIRVLCQRIRELDER